MPKKTKKINKKRSKKYNINQTTSKIRQIIRKHQLLRQQKLAAKEQERIAAEEKAKQPVIMYTPINEYIKKTIRERHRKKTQNIFSRRRGLPIENQYSQSHRQETPPD